MTFEFAPGDGYLPPAVAREMNEPPALPYHRMTRLDQRTSRWWLPLTTFLVAAGIYLAFLVPIIVIAVSAEIVRRVAGVDLPAPSDDLGDPLNPLDWVANLGLLALGIPAVVLGVRWGGLRPGTIHSVVGRIRWRLLGSAAIRIAPVYAVVIIGQAVIWPPEDFRIPPVTAALVISYVLIVLLTPLQCAAEEYAFRGLPQQMLGTWLKSPLWGILIPVPLFMLGHGYDWVGQISIAVFALCTGFLTWKSGGLELPIVLHTSNNLFIFLAAPFSPSALEQGAVDPMGLLLDLPLLLGATAWLTWWVSKREGVGLWEPVRGGGRPAKADASREESVAPPLAEGHWSPPQER